MLDAVRLHGGLRRVDPDLAASIERSGDLCELVAVEKQLRIHSHSIVDSPVGQRCGMKRQLGDGALTARPGPVRLARSCLPGYALTA